MVSAPFRLIRWIQDALELRRLRRLMRSAHRGLISEHGRTRPETDAEYLDRLRQMEDERFGR
jgi:hypothetical protein